MNAGADERERFNFTMFLSVAVHGILIFGTVSYTHLTLPTSDLV